MTTNHEIRHSKCQSAFGIVTIDHKETSRKVRCRYRRLVTFLSQEAADFAMVAKNTRATSGYDFEGVA